MTSRFPEVGRGYPRNLWGSLFWRRREGLSGRGEDPLPGSQAVENVPYSCHLGVAAGRKRRRFCGRGGNPPRLQHHEKCNIFGPPPARQTLPNQDSRPWSRGPSRSPSNLQGQFIGQNPIVNSRMQKKLTITEEAHKYRRSPRVQEKLTPIAEAHEYRRSARVQKKLTSTEEAHASSRSSRQ